MADSISLTLTANGTSVPGDSTVSSFGRENTIEVLSFEQSVFSNFDRATYRRGSLRLYAPVKFTKRLDRSTPLLRQAIINNETMAGSFRWFRPSPSGTGTTEHMLTLSFTAGGISRATLLLPDVLQPASATLPAMEAIELTLGAVTWTWEPDGIEFQDLNDRSS